MIKIEDYILLELSERQLHLKLDEACIKRGGMSSYCKGLMAHILNTTIPSGYKINVCHACHNSACSNPNHMYWGTSSENSLDRMRNGGLTIWENAVLKYGEEKAREIYSKKAKIAGAKGGKAGKGRIPWNKGLKTK